MEGFVEKINNFYYKNRDMFLKEVPHTLAKALTEAFDSHYKMVPSQKSMALELFNSLIRNEDINKSLNKNV